MSALDRQEFGMLLAAHANGELTPDETARMRALAADDDVCRRELDDVDAVLGAFADERALFGDLAQPVDPAEEIEPGYERLQRAAARAEDELRAKLRHPLPSTGPSTTAASSPASRLRWVAGLAGLAAVVLVGLLIRHWADGSGRPELMTGTPDDLRLGAPVARVLVEFDESAAIDGEPAARLRWHAVIGAASYDAHVVDGAGRVVSSRSATAEQSTEWEWTADDLAEVRSRSLSADESGLFARVEARAADGRIVGRSGDVPLTLGR